MNLMRGEMNLTENQQFTRWTINFKLVFFIVHALHSPWKCTSKFILYHRGAK